MQERGPWRRRTVLTCAARFKVKPHAFGFEPGGDVDRLNQLADDLETEETAGKLRR